VAVSTTLSSDQLAAIKHRGSHLQIIACAGSGKTEVMARRVAALIEEKVAPASIIAFTFTERASASLKLRIHKRIADSMGAAFLDRLGPMFIGTIHSYCLRMLQEHVPHYGNRYKPFGSTATVDFVTKRPVTPTQNSHINLVVQHSDWEAEAAHKLEESKAVRFYARNDHVGLTVPYDLYGLSHSYEPDFLVRLINDLTVVLEIKGYEVHEMQKTQHKHNAARRWVEAVNNLGDFGRWDFLVCRDVAVLPTALEKLAEETGVGIRSAANSRIVSN